MHQDQPGDPPADRKRTEPRPTDVRRGGLDTVTESPAGREMARSGEPDADRDPSARPPDAPPEPGRDAGGVIKSPAD